MKLNTSTTHCRTTIATLNEVEINQLLASAVAAEAGIRFEDRNLTDAKVVIRQRERLGTAGFEYYAEVTLTEDLELLPSESGPTDDGVAEGRQS